MDEFDENEWDERDEPAPRRRRASAPAVIAGGSWMIFGGVALLFGGLTAFASVQELARGGVNANCWVIFSAVLLPLGLVLMAGGWKTLRGTATRRVAHATGRLSILTGIGVWLVGGFVAYFFLTFNLGPPKPLTVEGVLVAVGLVFPCGAIPIVSGVLGIVGRRRVDDAHDSDASND